VRALTSAVTTLPEGRPEPGRHPPFRNRPSRRRLAAGGSGTALGNRQPTRAPGTRGQGFSARSGGIRGRTPRQSSRQVLRFTSPNRRNPSARPLRPPSLSRLSACFVDGGSYTQIRFRDAGARLQAENRGTRSSARGKQMSACPRVFTPLVRTSGVAIPPDDTGPGS